MFLTNLEMRKISTHVSIARMKKKETQNEQKTRRKERRVQLDTDTPD